MNPTCDCGNPAAIAVSKKTGNPYFRCAGPYNQRCTFFTFDGADIAHQQQGGQLPPRQHQQPPQQYQWNNNARPGPRTFQTSQNARNAPPAALATPLPPNAQKPELAIWNEMNANIRALALDVAELKAIVVQAMDEKSPDEEDSHVMDEDRM